MTTAESRTLPYSVAADALTPHLALEAPTAAVCLPQWRPLDVPEFPLVCAAPNTPPAEEVLMSLPHSSGSPESGGGTGPSSAAAQELCLFERVGGPRGVRAVVELFYGRVMDDPLLAPYFAGIDVERLRAHQRWFLAGVLGGPDAYAGRDLLAAHCGLGVTGEAFDRVADHLLLAFADLGVAESDRDQIAAAVLSCRALIVDDSPTRGER